MRRVMHISILLVLSVAVLAVPVFAIGFERTVRAVTEAGVAAFAAVGALTLAFLLIQSVAWTILNRAVQHRVSFRTLLEASVVGLAGNILTPSTFLGGEPLKIIYVGRNAHLPYHEVAGTVLMSKYLEGISFILFFSFSVVVATVGHSDLLFGKYLAVGVTVLALAAALLVLCGVLWLSLSRRWRPLTLLVGALSRLPLLSRRLGRTRERTRDMEDQVSRVFCEEGGATWRALAVHAAAHVTLFLKPALFFYLGASMRLNLAQLCLLFAVGQALLAFQLTPSGAGVLDTGLIGAFAVMGLNQPHDLANCMAFLLCLRFWDALLIGAGALLAARTGAGFFSSRPERIAPAGSPEDEPPGPNS